MSYAQIHNAICFEDLKNAALYFDHVIPFAFSPSIRSQGKGKDALLYIPDEIPGNVFAELLSGKAPDTNEPRWRSLGGWMNATDEFLNAIWPAIDGNSDFGLNETLKRAYLDDTPIGENSSVRKEFRRFAESLGHTHSTVLLPESDDYANTSTYSALTLSDIPLVDVSKASWEQISELRKDPDARSELRNLRLFFHDTYAEQSPTYIKDDLHRRIEEYDSARKRLGFDAVTGSISALLDAKAVQAAAATGIAATLIGGPIGGISSAVLIELGSMALELSKKRFAIKQFENTHELAYLIRANKELS